jgi:hypothetical protein
VRIGEFAVLRNIIALFLSNDTILSRRRRRRSCFLIAIWRAHLPARCWDCVRRLSREHLNFWSHARGSPTISSFDPSGQPHSSPLVVSIISVGHIARLGVTLSRRGGGLMGSMVPLSVFEPCPFARSPQPRQKSGIMELLDIARFVCALRRRRSLSLMWICARACLCVKSVGPVRAQFAPVLWTRLRPFSPTRGRHRNVRVGAHQTLAPCKFFSRFLHRRINVRVINSEAELGIVY